MSTPENGIEERIRQREATLARQSGPLETVPAKGVPTNGNIPNTPLASSFIAFCLGTVFTLGSLLFVAGGYGSSWLTSWLTSQFGAFAASWAIFHYLEFAVTAGWNREKCSVDCECMYTRSESCSKAPIAYLLDNGAQYHIANGIAVLEYVAVKLFFPSAKAWPYVTEIGTVSPYGPGSTGAHSP